VREIKFRAFLEKQQGGYDVCYSDPLFPHIFWNHIYKAIYDLGPEQYTGMKDKNGKDIYEGDILEFSMHSRKIGVVSFEEGSFVLISHDSTCITDLECEKCCFLEIIGNIHQNRELLETGNERV